MSIKLQINSLEALERLIGGDNDVELEIRSSIVQEFSKRHLKDLANEELFIKTGEAIKTELKESFFNITTQNYRTVTVFKPEVLSELKKSLHYKANTELREVIEDLINERKINGMITEQLENSAKWVVDSLQEATLKNRLDKMVDAKIKEKFNLK